MTFNEHRAIQNLGDIVAAIVAVAFVALATRGLWKLTLFYFERSTGGRAKFRRSS